MPNITISREWLERLIKMAEKVKNEEDDEKGLILVAHLLGYIEGSSELLKK